jgi:YnbE-like lipoprotein
LDAKLRICFYDTSDSGVFLLGVRTVKDNFADSWLAPRRAFLGIGLFAAVAVTAACQPTVKLEAPQEPITINLNIKLDADVRIKLEKQAEDDIQANPDIF